MKKFFLSAMVTVFMATSVLASGENNVNYRVENSFAAEFRDAKNVQWTTTDNYTKATFTINATTKEAFYDNNGGMIGTSSSITIDDLPTYAKRSLAKRYAGYTINEAIRFEGVEDTSYFISATNEAQSLVLKVSAVGVISIYKTVKK